MKNKKWKSDYFRPSILDESQEFRTEFEEELQKSELNRVAFSRKFAEGGMAAVKKFNLQTANTTGRA